MKTRKPLCSALTILALSTVPAAFAADSGKGFIKDSIQGNLAEEQMGELAQTHATSEAVKSFGATLKADHATANDRAMEVAKKLGVTPPSGPSIMQNAGYKRLTMLSGAKFDSKFIKDAVEDHKKDIKMYEKEARSSNPDVAAYAKEILPTLKKHLETAEQLQNSIAKLD